MKLIWAGKWRRYHGEGWRQLFDIKTMALNLRDMVRVLLGLWQSYWLLARLKPDAIFIKGGYVCVPVGLAAALHHIPYLTHDSDPVPGLTNRLLARWATRHAVGLPKELYPYPAATTDYVGVPVAVEYKPVTKEQKTAFRRALDVPSEAQIVFVTGGGLGARALNEAVASITPDLLQRYPKLILLHGVGEKHEAAMRLHYDQLLKEQTSRVRVLGFISDQYRYSGAADVIISRAGATSLAEFAAQQKACVIVPNPVLTGGHQLKNVKPLVAANAVIVINEADLVRSQQTLLPAIEELLDSATKRLTLSRALAGFARPEAAQDLATLILNLPIVREA